LSGRSIAGAIAIDIFIFRLQPQAQARNGDVESIRKLQQVHMFLTCGVVEARVLSILMPLARFRLKQSFFQPTKIPSYSIQLHGLDATSLLPGGVIKSASQSSNQPRMGRQKVAQHVESAGARSCAHAGS